MYVYGQPVLVMTLGPPSPSNHSAGRLKAPVVWLPADDERGHADVGGGGHLVLRRLDGGIAVRHVQAWMHQRAASCDETDQQQWLPARSAVNLPPLPSPPRT